MEKTYTLDKEEFLKLMQEFGIKPKFAPQFALDLRQCGIFVTTNNARIWTRFDFTQPKWVQR